MAQGLAQVINRFIGQGTPLSGKGAAFVASGQRYGVDPRVLVMIAKKESSFGATSGRFRNNAFGWGVHLDASHNTFPTWEAGIDTVAKGLAGALYKGSGLRTTDQIIRKYAPPSENNTGQYQQQLRQWGQQLGLQPGASAFGSPQVVGPQGGAPIAAPQGNRVDATRLLQILHAQSQRSLQGIMPGPNYTRQISKLAQSAGAQVAAVATEAVGIPSDPSKDQAVNAAKSQLGVPYVWGAGGPGGPTTAVGHGTKPLTGFDCSSLVQYAWAKKGVTLPRTTYDQIHAGRGISTSNRAAWKPGDLLFPSTHHVQMYIGGGKVIEAPQTGGHVQIVPARGSYIAVRRPG